MERYEFREGSSHKFWEVSVNGDELTVRFGKIGTAGQTKSKTFASAAAAEKEKSKLVKEKTGKGYVATGLTAPAAAPARSETPKAAPPAKKPPKPNAEMMEATENEKLAASSAPAATKGPGPSPATGNVRLVTGDPLPTRMRPAQARAAGEAWIAFAHAVQHMAANAKNKDEWPTHIVSGSPPKSMCPETAASWSTELHTAARGNIQGRSYVVRENWGDFLNLYMDFAFWLVAAHGAVLAIRAVELLPQTLHATTAHYGTAPWSIVPHIAFRSAITAAPTADYDAAVRHCLAQPSPGWERAALLAFILADDRPERHALQVVSVLESAAAQGIDVGATPSLVPLVAEAPNSLAKTWRSKRTYFIYFVYFVLSAGRIAATAVAAANRHQESALPVLDWLLHYATDDARTTIACAMLDTHEEDALAALMPYLHEKQIRAALDQASENNPAWMFQRTLALLAGASVEPALRARALKAIEVHGAQTTGAWAQALGGRSEKYYETLAALGNQATADAKDVPSFLRAPPWRAVKKASTDIVLRIEPKDAPLVFKDDAKKVAPPTWVKMSVPDGVAALVGLIAAAEKEIASNSWHRIQPSTQPLPPPTASEQDVHTWLSLRLDEVAAASRWASGTYVGLLNGVHLQQDALALLMWDKPAAMHLGWGIDWHTRISTMLTRFGDKAVPGLVKIVEADPTALLAHVKDVGTPALASVAARAYMKLKKAREPGRAWLRAHPRAALLRLVPLAVGPLGANRDAAEYAVRWYKTEKPDVLDTVIAEYADAEPQVPAAIAQVLARDPYARTPTKVAKPPSWVVISSLTRPKLKAGGALPDDAMTALVEMLSFVNPADVYAGVPALREASTPDSLAAFAWDLFSAWLANGAPSKEGWAFRALGWLGDDESARQLTRLVRKWPGESAHARAVTGLDVLADIGSDVALMNLNGIAEKVKFKGLQERARDKIAAIAEARDLSPEELADRLAPDLDLDARGGLDLYFGPRKFRAGFDEFLKPWVKDESGKRLKDLPKPIKSDDAEKSGEASAKWSALKKDARTIASQQLTRLENMLATGRRAKGEVFYAFFAAHPLIRHLAQRLVWGVYDTDKVDAAPMLYFRVTEDLSFNDANDDPVTVDVGPEATGLIGLAHPLHMSEDDQARWGALFGDYEIAQPFAQLGRETYALTDAEKSAEKLTRFAGKQVESKRLRGMASRGWRTGQPQDGGGILWVERTAMLADGTKVPAMLHFSDGLWAGAAADEPPTQTLDDITLGASYWSRQNARRLGELDAVTASEILRAITQLVDSSGT